MNAKIKAFIAFITIFLLGAVAGYFMNNVIHRTGQPMFTERGFERGNFENRRNWDGNQAGRQGESDRRREWIENHFTRKLELQEPQRDVFFEKLSGYNREIRGRISEQRTNEREMLRDYYNEFRENVSETLTAEQLIKLDAMVHPDSVHHMRMERLRSGRGR